MTNWIFYLSLPSASHHKIGKTKKSWANAWINSHECHRRSKYCINISTELHMLDVERCLLLSEEALRPPVKATYIGYDSDWKELSHDYHSIIPSQWIEKKCETSLNGFSQKCRSCSEYTITATSTASTHDTSHSLPNRQQAIPQRWFFFLEIFWLHWRRRITTQRYFSPRSQLKFREKQISNLGNFYQSHPEKSVPT